MRASFPLYSVQVITCARARYPPTSRSLKLFGSSPLPSALPARWDSLDLAQSRSPNGSRLSPGCRRCSHAHELVDAAGHFVSATLRNQYAAMGQGRPANRPPQLRGSSGGGQVVAQS